jgi:hypothetical protein
MVLGKAGVFSCLSVSLVVGAMLAPAATAQTTGDPAAGSPPRAVYQIPLERGRSDAAPRKRSKETAPSAGKGNDGSGGSSSGSVYRSENGFGSSSHVPGSAGGNPNNSDKDPSKDGAHSRADLSGTGDSPLPSGAVDSGNTSLPGSLGLLALIVVAGVGIGFIALRSRRLGR